MKETKFLIDAQLPPALARFLAAKTGTAVHVADLGAKEAPVIVWIRFGNTSRKELLRRIGPMVDLWIERIGEGERLLEVR